MEALAKLGIEVSLTPFDPDGLTVKLDAGAFKDELIYLRAKGANIQSFALRYDEAGRVWGEVFNDKDAGVVEIFRNSADHIRTLPDGTALPAETATKLHLEGLQRAAEAADITPTARWLHSVLSAFPDYFEKIPPELAATGLKVWSYYRAAWDDALGLLRPSGAPLAYAAKLTGAAVGALLGVLDGVAEYKKAGGFTEQFWQWAAVTVGVAAVAIPVFGAAASFAMSAAPVWGTVGV